MCKFTFKKLISLILCGSAMNCSAAFAMDQELMDPELKAHNYSGEDSSIYEGSPISIPESMKDSIPMNTLHIPGEEHLTTDLLNNNEESGYQHEDGQLVNEHNQAPSYDAGENGNVGDYAQAVNEEIHQTDNANSNDTLKFLNQKRNFLPDYFPNNFTDGYLWKFPMDHAPSYLRALTCRLTDETLQKQFKDSRLFAPASTNKPRLGDLEWGTNVVNGELKEPNEKLHRKFFNTISKLINDVNNTKRKRSRYVAVELSTPFGIVKTSLLPKGKSLILQRQTTRPIPEFKNLKKSTQINALNIIRDYLAESQGGKYYKTNWTGTKGANCYSIKIDDPRYNGEEHSELFDETELPCLRRLFFDLVYRLPNKYNDSGIFEIAYINWYLNKVEALSDEPVQQSSELVKSDGNIISIPLD